MSFGPRPLQVEAALGRGATPEELIDELLALRLPFVPDAALAAVPDGGLVDIDAGDTDDLRYHRRFREWWFMRMVRNEGGVHEKLMWFWHGHFATSHLKVDSTNLCWRQLRTLHQHALGNFRDLLRAMTVDGAMLRFLDGDGSIGSAPNENYSREMMELFTLGLGTFGQSDVVNGAKALAGWTVADDLSVEFRPEAGAPSPMTFLDHQVQDVDGVVEAVLAHDGCAPFVVTKLWQELIGGDPDPASVARWAKDFRASDYELGPLVESMVHDRAFIHSLRSRAKTPIEWYSALVALAGPQRDFMFGLRDLGQVPFEPPNVSGWPGDAAWSSITHVRARYGVAQKLDYAPLVPLLDSSDVVADVLASCGLFDPTEPTSKALANVADAARSDGSTPVVAVGLLASAAAMSPEFSRS